MKQLHIVADMDGDLLRELSSGFASISIKRARLGHPTEIVLRRQNDDALVVKSKMHDLAERTEVGVMHISRAAAEHVGGETVMLPAEFAQKTRPFVLTVLESGVEAESGIVLQGERGGEIIIIAGAFPGTVAVLGSVLVDPFDPEYELSDYVRSPLGLPN